MRNWKALVLFVFLFSIGMPGYENQASSFPIEDSEDEDIFEEDESEGTLSQETISHDPIANAEFFDTSQLNPVKHTNKYAFGAVVVGAYEGWGMILTRDLWKDNLLWVTAAYSPKRRLLFLGQTPTGTITPEVYRLDRTQILFGYDKVLRASAHWGAVVGLGMALDRSDYQSRYCPQNLVRFCAHDPSQYVQKFETDFYGMLFGRFGIEITDIRLWNTEGYLRIMMNPKIIATPHLRLTSPEGTQFEEFAPTQLFIEMTIAI